MNEEYTPRTQAMLDEVYWPWPLALAYCQPNDKRAEAVEAVAEILEEYSASTHKELAPFKGSSAVARLYEVATGKSYGAESSEQYWTSVAEIERPLLANVKTGSLDAMGRSSPAAALVPIAVSDWVGGEVHPEATADLIAEGWRANDTLDQVLGDQDRTVRFFDVHLLGAAVRQLAAVLDSNDRTDETLSGEYEVLERLEAEGECPAEGYWSPLVAGAWIGSRSDSFVAAVQRYERNMHCDRGGAYSSAAWWSVGNLMGKRYGVTLTESLDRLRVALERGLIVGGKARPPLGGPRLVDRHEWTAWRTGHNNEGVSLLPGLVDFGWPSENIRQSFPAATQEQCEGFNAPAFTQDDLLKACDELWKNEKNVREIEGAIQADPRFVGATVEYIREVIKGRYPRIGKGGREARERALRALG